MTVVGGANFRANEEKIATHSTSLAVEDQEDIQYILSECGNQWSYQMCGIQ